MRTIYLSQHGQGVTARYLVTRIVNSLMFDVNVTLDPSQVADLCDDADWKVVIT